MLPLRRPRPVSPTPQQDESNGGAAHAESDAERMETESEDDVEKQIQTIRRVDGQSRMKDVFDILLKW